jgi:hypothetical protein
MRGGVPAARHASCGAAARAGCAGAGQGLGRCRRAGWSRGRAGARRARSQLHVRLVAHVEEDGAVGALGAGALSSSAAIAAGPVPELVAEEIALLEGAAAVLRLGLQGGRRRAGAARAAAWRAAPTAAWLRGVLRRAPGPTQLKWSSVAVRQRSSQLSIGALSVPIGNPGRRAPGHPDARARCAGRGCRRGGPMGALYAAASWRHTSSSARRAAAMVVEPRAIGRLGCQLSCYFVAAPGTLCGHQPLGAAGGSCWAAGRAAVVQRTR